MNESVSSALAATACAYWYACGYNDHRPQGALYVDPHKFAATWVSMQDRGSRPSMQDAFAIFLEAITL